MRAPKNPLFLKTTVEKLLNDSTNKIDPQKLVSTPIKVAASHRNL